MITKISSIHIGSRFRQEYKDIPQLAESIQRIGLIHPILLDQDNNLVAGGRRLRAYIYLDKDEIECTLKEDLTELDRRIIEVEENIQRQDLEWHELIALRAEVDKLMMEQHKDDKSEDGYEVQGWTQNESADLLGISHGTLADNLSLLKAIEQIPELKNLTTEKEAKQVLKEYSRYIHIQEMLDDGTLELPKDFDFEKAYQIGDAIEEMSIHNSVADNNPSVLFAEVDTPYGVDLNKLREDKINYEEWSKEEFEPKTIAAAREVYRELAPDAWCIWWFAWVHSETVKMALNSVGFTLDKVPIIWTKTGHKSTSSRPDLYLARGYEQCFVCRKGNPTLYGAGRSNVFNYPAPDQATRIHPAERSVGLIRDLLRVFAVPGATILSPFLGSGNTIIAAYQEGMKCFGWDLSEATRLDYLQNVGRLKK